MMEHRPSTPDHRGDDRGGGFVERERAEVLHHHQVGVPEGPFDLAHRRRVGGGHGQPGEEAVDGAFAGDGADVETEDGEGAAPLRRLDGHPVGAPQAERHDGGDRSGHGPATLLAARRRAISGWASNRVGRYRRSGVCAPERSPVPRGGRLGDPDRAVRGRGRCGPGHHQPSRASQRHVVGGHGGPSAGTVRGRQGQRRPCRGPGRRR